MLSPIHGDPDLFVSRSIEFPDQIQNDRRSNAVGNRIDMVGFSKDDPETNNTIKGTYYIAVYAYSYASYVITARVHRPADTLGANIVKLHEGLPI